MKELESAGLESVDKSADIESVQFEQLADLFVELGVFASPSELHGLLCGQLAGGVADAEQDWLDRAASYLERKRIDSEQGKVAMLNLYTWTKQQLQGVGFELELVLPDDETDLSLRAESIGLWCQGFLAAFGVDSLSKLSEEARETVNDFSEIVRIGAEQLEDCDDNEQDLMQIIEYVRMATILVYSEVHENQSDAATHQAPPSVH